MSTSWPRVRTLVSTAALAGIVACGEQAPSAAPEGGRVLATKLIGALEARLSAPGRVKQDSAITLSVEVVNRGDSPATIDAPFGDGAPPFDVLVTSTSGETVWREPTGDRAGAALNFDPIAPGATLHYGTARWALRDLRGAKVSPGAYRVSVLLHMPIPSASTTVGPVTVVIDP